MLPADTSPTVGRMTKWLIRGIVAGTALFLLAQLVPYGRNHTNPPVTQSVKWNSPRTEQLAAGACSDCHSNLTDWKWYSNIAPFSWLIYKDVVDGRANLNFSEWNKPQADAGDIVETVQNGSMPPLQYKPLHAGGRLSNAQRDELVHGLRATLTQDPPIPGGGGG
jgi:mono/diheme cytochrome c family protein